MNERSVSIVGLGCIGGSLARALVAHGVPVRAWSLSAEDRALAPQAGVPVSESLAAAVSGASAVVLAVPLPALHAVVAEALVVAPAATFLHTVSLQRLEAIGLAPPMSARVFGTHPLAGSHASGFAASRADLFAGATVSIEARATAGVRAVAEEIWRAARATRIDYRDAAAHDELMAWVSHLPQLAATALAGTLAALGAAPRDAGPGARDSTRLAASPLELWAPLLRGAPADLDAALAALEARVAELRRALAGRDAARLAALWEPAHAWRRSVEDRP